MTERTRWPSTVLVTSALMAFLTGAAQADCLRHVYNRSPYALMVTQDGGPPVTVRPGASQPIRLSVTGTLDVVATCGPNDFGAPIARGSFPYTAVQDRCYFEIGHDFFDAELGAGFLPRHGTTPFTLNTPRQGDLVLAADRSACLPPR